MAGQLIEGQTIYTIGASSSELAKFKRIAGECSYIGREGVEFYPQELMIFRFEENGPQKGTAWLRTSKSIVRNIRYQSNVFWLKQNIFSHS